MKPEQIGLGILLLIILSFVVLGRPPSSVNGLTPVKENAPRFHLTKEKGNGEGTYDFTVPGTLEDGATTRTGSFVLYRGKLWENEKAPSNFKASFTPDYYFFDPELDLGTFGAYRSNSSDDTSAFQAGLRYSPARFLWGTVAPDLIVSADVAGAGFSIFPPPKFFGGWWQHLGLGIWYSVPLGDDTAEATSDWMYGLSFSTRDF